MSGADGGLRPPAAPRARPFYHHPPEKVHGWRLREFARLHLVENLFFAAATLFSVLFAAIVFRQGVSNVRDVAYLLVFWAVLAYLALPRVHRILTSLYVPDYFIGRARTSDGLLGDPVNLAFTGDERAIHEAMRRAGWVEADPVNLTTSWRIVASSLRRRSYAQAPVSPLLLFGQIQSFAYQQEIDGNPSQRHHVRFWPCPPGWLLPGGHRVDWLAAGSYDRAVGFSLFTFQVTHKIDRDIDIERDYIVETIRYASPQVGVRTIEDFSTGYHHRNGGGDAISTDGDLPVVDVRALAPAGPDHDEGEQSGHKDDLLHDVGRRPFSVVAAGGLALVSILASVGIGLRDLLAARVDSLADAGDAAAEATLALWTVLGVLLVMSLLLGLLAWLTYQGRAWARIVMMVGLSGSLVVQLVQFLGRDRPAFPTLLGLSVDVLTIYALTSLSAREWTRSRGRRRHRDRPGRPSPAA